MCEIPLRIGGEIKWTRGRPTLAFAGQKRPSVPRHPDAFAEITRCGAFGLPTCPRLPAFCPFSLPRRHVECGVGPICRKCGRKVKDDGKVKAHASATLVILGRSTCLWGFLKTGKRTRKLFLGTPGQIDVLLVCGNG